MTGIAEVSADDISLIYDPVYAVNDDTDNGKVLKPVYSLYNGTIQIQFPFPDRYRIKLYTISGTYIRSYSFEGAKLCIQKGRLSAGVYLFSCTGRSTKTAWNGKYIIQ